MTAADRQAAAARQRRHTIALWRWALTEPAMDPALTSRQRGQVVRQLASREHEGPDGRMVSVSRRTIDRWVVARREGGFGALVPSPRQCPPRAGTETEELAAGLKMENPARTGAQVRRILAVQLGWAPSVRTIQRWLEARELTTRPGGEPPEAFGRFQADQVNEIWTADLMNGPKVAGRPSFLAGIIDDRSRFLAGARFVRRADAVRFAAVLRAAIAAHGIPRILYEAYFGVRLADPVDEFNAARHVGADSPQSRPPPTPDRLAGFFGFLRERVGTARVFASAARDYALYRTLYHAGLRSEEAVTLDAADLHFDRGPFGKIHVRFGKAARGSGPRPRWVPMLDGLDLILRWYLDDVRPRLPAGLALFPDQSGGRLHRGSVRNRLAHLLELEARGTGGPVQPARDAAGLRDPQLRARGQPGRDPADARALADRHHDAVRLALVHVHRGRLPAGSIGDAGRTGEGGKPVKVTWRLRMAAAQREVWTGAQLRRLLAERAGLSLSSASVSALLTGQPAQLKLSTLAALCTALDCTPNDLLEVDTTPVTAAAAPERARPAAAPARRGRSMPPL